MNYLIEINVPGEGWKPFIVNRGVPLDAVLSRIRVLYPGDEIHDLRVKYLRTREQIIRAIRDAHNYWKKNDRTEQRRRNKDRGPGRDTRGQHGHR